MLEDGVEKILKSKEELNRCLTDFLNEYDAIKDDSSTVQNRINSLLSCHTDTINCVNQAVSQTHQKQDFFYNIDLQQEYLATIEGFIPVSLKTHDVLNLIVTKHNLTAIPINQHTYTLCQRLVNTFSTKEIKTNLYKEFESRNIPVFGFKQKFKRMKDKELRLQLIIGVPLLILCLGIIFFGEYFLGQKFNGIQLIALKALLSLTISVVGSSLIEGTVKTNWTLQKGLTIRAFGWVAVFLLLYFLNPANPGDVY